MGGWWLREAAPRIPAGPATPEPRAGHSLPPLLLAWTGPEVLLLRGCPHSGPESRVQTACPSALPSPWDHHCPTSQGGTGLWSGPAPLAGKWELGPCGQPLAGWPPGWSPPSPGPGTPLASECPRGVASAQRQRGMASGQAAETHGQRTQVGLLLLGLGAAVARADGQRPLLQPGQEHRQHLAAHGLLGPQGPPQLEGMAVGREGL